MSITGFFRWIGLRRGKLIDLVMGERILSATYAGIFVPVFSVNRIIGAVAGAYPVQAGKRSVRRV